MGDSALRIPNDAHVVLVTGGTGSFGSTVVERILESTSDVEVRIFSRDELKQHEMRSRLASDRVRFYIGDVRDRQGVEQAMVDVDLVFHAAALKQVPSCEFFPMEATRTNVIGSSNVIEAAHAKGVKSVVCLGTDKAVYPINAMGMSKAMMEKVAQAFARNFRGSSTTVSTVRYGNVMASRGSVIPLFVEQIQSGRAITLTDPAMTRFLMSLDEAVLLVQHAFESADPGDLFVRKAPACTVGDLATAVCELMDVEPHFEVIGTRHGEKLYETLATREELARSNDQGDFYRVPLDARDLNYRQYFDEGDSRTSHEDDYNSHNTKRLSVEEVKGILRALPAFVKLLEGRRSN